MNEETIKTIETIGAIAVEAMLYEVAATPKPGLVDRKNSGAHHDMDFYTFMSSAAALHNVFDRMLRLGLENQDQPIKNLLAPLRQIGIQAEKQMFEMTQGINTHKGMIFTLGILSACAGYAAGKTKLSSDKLCGLAAEMCAGICQRDYHGLTQKAQLTKGEKMYLQHGLTGVRGEVESGYQTVREISLPIYRKLRNTNVNINDALVQTLLHLIANTKDTNIISRHNLKTAQYAKKAAQKLIEKGGIYSANGYDSVAQLDQDFIERYISPGGCADLLAVTHFLHVIENLINAE